MAGTLFVVATPIGNLKDITQRAIETIGSCDLVLCEDTRKTGVLLSQILPQKSKTLLSYFDYNETQRIPQVLAFLKSGQNVALVSDAGTPLVSDPGFKLVRSCIEEGIPVVSIPGPSAPTAALTVSGLPTDQFLFLGYLPEKSGHRKRLLVKLQKASKILSPTIIFFEAPHKIARTLEQMQEVFGDISIVMAREMTKVFEEVRREKISQSLEHFQKTKPKGEFTILFNLRTS